MFPDNIDNFNSTPPLFSNCSSPGLMIEFSGIDSSGKTMMLEMTKSYLESIGLCCFATFTPTPRIRNSIFFRSYIAIAPHLKEYESFGLSLQVMDDILQHCNDTLVPRLKDGYVVLCKRYAFSILAETFIHVRDIEIARTIRNINGRIPQADLTIMLKISPEIALQRIEKRRTEGKWYKPSDIDYLSQEAEAYNRAALEYSIPTVCSDGSPEETFAQVKKLIDSLLAEKYSGVKPKSQVAENSSPLYLSGVQDELQQEAIMNMIQMVAHDARQPFAMLGNMIEVIRTSGTGNTDKLVNECIPVIEKAVNSIDAMLDDIMEIGRPVQKNSIIAVDPKLLVESSLNDRFDLKQRQEISMRFNYDHKFMVHADVMKIQRVIINIVENALQAIQGRESIWFRTSDADKGQVEFCIGNSGSYIPEDSIDKIFTLFYSRGKSSGTGLGLAVVRKIINDHGGKIWCSSSKEKMETEFYFTLPSARGVCTVSLSQNLEKFVKKAGDSNSQSVPVINEIKDDKPVVKILQDKPIARIALIDDDPMIRMLWCQFMSTTDNVQVISYENHQDFFNKLNEEPLCETFDCVIVDRYVKDFDSVKGGFATTCRNLGYKGPIILASGSFTSRKDAPPDFDAAIDKHVRTWDNILEILNKRNGNLSQWIS